MNERPDDHRRLSCESVSSIYEDITKDIEKYKNFLKIHLHIPDGVVSQCHHRQQLTDHVTALIRVLEDLRLQVGGHVNCSGPQIALRDRSGRNMQVDSGIDSSAVPSTYTVSGLFNPVSADTSSATLQVLKFPTEESGESIQVQQHGFSDLPASGLSFPAQPEEDC